MNKTLHREVFNKGFCKEAGRTVVLVGPWAILFGEAHGVGGPLGPRKAVGDGAARERRFRRVEATEALSAARLVRQSVGPVERHAPEQVPRRRRPVGC